YAEREKILTVRGPYRYNRNPYYVAQMIMDFGFFLIAGRPLLFLIYFPIIFSVYRYWVRKEESFLENEFGDDYRTLKREVPRWSFRLKPAPARGSQLSFRWAIFKLNRELPRALSHLGLMLIFIGYFFLGNPFEAVSPLGRITIIAAVAVWLVIHDIYPLQPIEKSLAWVLLALACAVFAIVFLICGLVWQPWTGASAWISIVAGGLLGLLVAGDSVAQWHGRPIKQTRKFFAAPVRQLYGIALAFGLISCTLGGVWLAITTALVIWLLCVGGILPASSARPAYS
ncbi:MAG TPA: methyltransferase, partial [Candidatus Eisenbacteria bacterium]|nr:methyltransferase [Candidatus Eisenbacteria bacterium]